MNKPPLISCITTTFGRHTMMNRLLAFYLAQTYANRELIIFNTAPTHLSVAPETLLKDHSLGMPDRSIRVMNQSTRSFDNKPYTNVGDVRTDAVARARGDIFCLLDDDDAYFPYHISQGVEKLLACGKRAWKPAKSLFSTNGGKNFEPCSNALEASCFVYMYDIRRLGFKAGTGDENLSWYNGLRNEGQFCEDPNGVASYVYEWGSEVAPHKQSGDIKNPSNFENHKRASTDFGAGKPLTGDYDIASYFNRVIEQYPNLLPYFTPTERTNCNETQHHD